ncbi:MAG: sulfotransferase domain-containing protein [Chloroflexi bacterium]|nr:sulfotransferase domain-containing protein [Chloroflexota bacterium]
MIILAVGMPRAGSGWHYNLVHDLMETTGCDDARDIRAKFGLEKILTEVNCNIGVLSARRLIMVTRPALMGHTFVIKAHSAPTVWARALIQGGIMRATYIYRDPRDAMLSAFDYGKRVLEKQGRPNAFSHLTDFQKTMDFFTEYVQGWEKWMQVPGALKARYEDLLQDYEAESGKLVRFLGVNPSDEAVKAVVEKYRPGGQVQGQQGTHFFKGQVGRFRERYSAEEQKQLAEKFGPYLLKMGYEI